MNTIITSKEEILKNIRSFIRQHGLSALNIRSVASICGVSVGSIYNYFDCKAALMSEAVESVWRDIFDMPKEPCEFKDTEECISWLYEKMESGCKEYPDFFTFHCLGFIDEERADGKHTMQTVWDHITDSIYCVLKNDARIRPESFNETFTAEKFAEILFSLVLSSFIKHDWNYRPIVEILRRTLY